MIKVILSGSFSFGDPVAQLIPVHSRGVDHGWHEKRAAARCFDFDTLKPDKNEALVHLLAVGDGEVYGCNRNGDYFSKKANEDYHHTFLKAGYFHHHQNRDHSKRFGRVLATAHHPSMHRVELIVGIDTDKAASDLDELEKNGEFPVSMSTKVPYDVCSICDHKAKNRSEYCDHAANHLTKIAEDGRQVYVDNPILNYFDISKVFRPADRIAWTFERLQKAASGDLPGGAQLADELGIREPDWLPPVAVSRDWQRKVAVLKPIAAADFEPFSATLGAFKLQTIDSDTVKSLTKEAFHDVVGALHDEGVLLTVSDFVKLAGIDRPADVTDEVVMSAVRAIFHDVRSGSDGEAICKNGSYDGGYGQLSRRGRETVGKLARSHGLSPKRMAARIQNTVLANGIPSVVLQKSAGVVSPMAVPVAREYTAYLVSFAHRAGNEDSRTFVRNLVGAQLYL